MPDRRVDYEARHRQEQIQRGYERFARQVFWSLVLLAVVLVASLIANGFLVSANRDRIADVRALAVQIQQQRRETLLIACADQNARHDAAIATLDRLQPTPQGTTKHAIALLLDAAVPRRDCARLADRQAPGG